MDFKRIQVLLLIFFVIFDVFLAYLLVDKGAFGLNLKDPTAKINAIQEMKDRGVQISSNLTIDDKQPELAILKTAPTNELWANRKQLKNQNLTISPEGILVSEFTNPINLDISLGENIYSLTNEDFAWIRENVLMDEELFIHGDKYLNHWYSPQERLLIIRMVTKQGTMSDDSNTAQPIPISDGTGEIRILFNDNYDMVSYVQTYQPEMVHLQDRKPLISSNQALEIIENRIDTTLPNDAEIISVNQGYYQSVRTKEFNLYVPVWEVIYYRRENGQSLSVLVDAMKGNVVNNKGVN